MRRKYKEIWMLWFTYLDGKNCNIFEQAFTSQRMAYDEMLKLAMRLNPCFTVKGCEIEIPASGEDPPRLLWIKRQALRVK